jgi:hydrogenase nickel incorporation protein HypB
MGRFHRHEDGTEHVHEHVHEPGHQHGDQHGDESGPARQVADGHGLGDHSGYDTGSDRIAVLERIFDENDRVAACNRADLAAAGAYAVNLMSSPGAGKTTLLRETLRRLADHHRVGVIEGDIETSIDADRLQGFGATIELVNTGNGFGGECHLDAPMVRSALTRMDLGSLDLVLVENVGNLVCPAEFDVGQHARVMVHSITEGEEKPLKYPVMFRSADLVLINKMDLLPHLDVDMDLFRANLARVHPGVATLETSARTGAGLDEWCAWLEARLPVRSRA